jgi:hypothetical protein
MKTTITKSSQSKIGRTQTDYPAPPWTQLSFVKYSENRSGYIVDDYLNVPNETYGAGCVTGYRVAGELMAWAKKTNRDYARFTIQSVFETAQAVMAVPTDTPLQIDKECKRGAAAMVVWAIMDFLLFAANEADCLGFCEREANRINDYREREVKRKAAERVEFVERMRAARAAKRNLSAANDGEVAGGENG